ncbi:hypothetical protein [Chryseobacterium terrae]|uniref:6-bladed beta-propeller n=1 Tax=Chryseobacterium terrae TaxID=3163299 RepID=A0ABW8Y4V6_9FLAO
MYLKIIFFALSVFMFCSVQAQNCILLLSSGTNAKKVLQLSAVDGTVINDNFIDLSSQNTGTPKGITQVNDKIWITDQLNDKIYIYDLNGVFVSSITTGLDNIRG